MFGLLNFKNLQIKIRTSVNFKYLKLKILDNGYFLLNLPVNYSHNDVIFFLNQNYNWMIENKKEFKFLGKKYELIFEDNLENVFIDDLNFKVKNQKSLDTFLKIYLLNLINKYISEFSLYINKSINKISIRNSQNLWGSCNHKKSYLNFSLRLICQDKQFIRYVVLHEMTHLIYPHHKKSFYDFIEKIIPNFRLIQACYS